jgi:predicted amidohydrolase YtcJ
MVRLVTRVGVVLSILVALDVAFAPGTVTRAQPAPVAQQGVDLVLWNGKVVTVDPAFSLQEAIAISNDRIVAVGSNEAIRRLAGPATQVVDLHGRTVLPGLVDSHIHAIRGGLTWDDELHWDDVTSLAEGLQIIRAQVARTAPGSWAMVVGGWTPEQFPERRLPTQAELDAISADHPIWVQFSYDVAILNHAALSTLNITRETPDPPGGTILKDQTTGEPIGITTFFGINAFYSQIPRPTLDQQITSTRNYFRELNRVGLTTAGDVAGGGLTWPGAYQPVEALHDQGELTVRVRWYMQPGSQPGWAGRELELLRRFVTSVPPGSGDLWLRPVGVGEQVLPRVHDSDAFGAVPPTFPADALEDWREAVRLIAESGWRFQLHTTRSHSAEQLLPAVEEINREIPLTDRRLAWAHLEDATPAIIQRIKALNGGITVQDRLAFQGEQAQQNWSEAQVRQSPPLQTMLRLGVPVGGGTDSTRTTTYKPFLSLWWLISGKTVGGTVMRGPAESLTREQALRAYTTGSAWFSFDEDQVGSLESGKLADLIVLSGDYLTVSEDQIKNLESVLTIVGGKATYAAAEFQGLAPR